MISRPTPTLSALLLTDDMQLCDEKTFTAACVSVFLTYLAIVFVRWAEGVTVVNKDIHKIFKICISDIH